MVLRYLPLPFAGDSYRRNFLPSWAALSEKIGASD
jgi:hypothetical protein